ncbi:MAG: aminopeptidase P family protein [Clostridia bacterium]|nr:aminopeptidase P family protein [Clostridia bacterium]
MTRLDILRSRLSDNCDGVLLSSELSQFYMTGFHYTDGYALITKNNAYLITDFRYIEAAKNEADPEFQKVMYHISSPEIAEYLKKDNVQNLMFEDGHITVADLERLKTIFPNVKFLPLGNILTDMREFKSEYEAECIIKAQRIAEKAFEQLLCELNSDMTEREAAALLEYLMKKNGADDISFHTVAVSGKASSLPHGVPRNVKLEKGFLTFDFGAVYKGYHSDMTRTVCIGPADDEMKKIYDLVLEAQEAALKSIMDGETNCFAIDKVARDIIYNAGYTGCFGHGLGHGVGLQIHENPRLSSGVSKSKTLETGAVVTVEPGIYIEGKYGVRIEDMVYISENGPVNITKTPKKLIELLK